MRKEEGKEKKSLPPPGVVRRAGVGGKGVMSDDEY